MVSSTTLGYKAGVGACHRIAAFAVYAVALLVPASGKWEAVVLHHSSLLVSLVLLAVVAIANPGPARAQTQDIYTVRAVPVDATADSPVAAREQAVREGRRLAFERLVARLVPSDATGSVPPRTDAELGSLSLGFEVANERSSAVRYVGALTFAFDPGRVRSLLMSLGVPFAETRSLPVLVIPVLDSGGGAVLWEEPNPFRSAWSGAAIEAGLVPFVVPYGDIADIRDLTTADALAGDSAALGRIAERYGARDAVVVEARPRAGGAVEISVQRIGPTGFGTTLIEVVSPPAGAEGVPDDAARYAAAVRRTVTLVEDAWKRDNLIRGGLESRVTVTVPIDNMRRWLTVREALERTVIVSRFDVVQLTRGEALVDLWVNGDAEQLRVALEQRNLRLLPGAGDYVLIQRGQPLPSQQPPAQTDPGAPGGLPGGTPGTDQSIQPGPIIPAPGAAPAAPAPGAAPAAPAPGVPATTGAIRSSAGGQRS